MLEAFVTEEGTDYGHRDYSLGEKVAAVASFRTAVLRYDEATESVTVLPKDQLPVDF